VPEHVKAHLIQAYKFIFSTSFISHQLNASYRVTKIWWPYSLIKNRVKNICRRFYFWRLIPKSKKWFDNVSRTLYFLLRFNFTHWILQLLQPSQSWAVKSQRRFFGCIKARGDFLQVLQS